MSSQEPEIFYLFINGSVFDFEKKHASLQKLNGFLCQCESAELPGLWQKPRLLPKYNFYIIWEISFMN